MAMKMISMEINHHPQDDLLLSMATGTIDLALGIAVSAHVELCHECGYRLAALAAIGGAVLDDQPVSALKDGAFDETWAEIAADHRLEPSQTIRPADGKPLTVGAPLPLPPGARWPSALARCQSSPWRWLGPGMRWSRVKVPGAPQANLVLLRIGAGRYLPKHTHRGREATQIIFGHFHDGRSLFGPGDFDLADEQVHHQPVVQEGSECICLAAIEGGLRFDGFIAQRVGQLVGMS